jgi:hypothetical protein
MALFNLLFKNVFYLLDSFFQHCLMIRDGKNSLLFLEKMSTFFLVCFCLNLVGFLVASLVKNSPFNLLFCLTNFGFF